METDHLIKGIFDTIGGEDPNKAARALCFGLSSVFINSFARAKPAPMTEDDFLAHTIRNVREAIHWDGNKPVAEDSLVWMPPRTNIIIAKGY